MKLLRHNSSSFSGYSRDNLRNTFKYNRRYTIRLVEKDMCLLYKQKQKRKAMMKGRRVEG